MQQKRSLDAGGVTLAIILGLLAGPLIFYALAGDYWHTAPVTDDTLARVVAGVAGAALGVGALVNATRFRNPGLAGGISGLAGGITELAVAVLPWVGFNATHHTCTSDGICPLDGNGLVQLALRAGGFAIIVYTLAGFALAMLISAVRGYVHSS
jgi:hypothetical protein